VHVVGNVVENSRSAVDGTPRVTHLTYTVRGR
jgi:hypothetical protein